MCAPLFVTGLVLPLVLSLLFRPMYSSDETIQLYVILSGIAVFLALALGYLGRRHVSGKVAMIGAITVIAWAFLFAALRSYTDTHIHLYKMHQGPWPKCKCRWSDEEPDVIDGAVPPPGAVPMTPVAGGGPL